MGRDCVELTAKLNSQCVIPEKMYESENFRKKVSYET